MLEYFYSSVHHPSPSCVSDRAPTSTSLLIISFLSCDRFKSYNQILFLRHSLLIQHLIKAISFHHNVQPNKRQPRKRLCHQSHPRTNHVNWTGVPPFMAARHTSLRRYKRRISRTIPVLRLGTPSGPLQTRPCSSRNGLSNNR